MEKSERKIRNKQVVKILELSIVIIILLTSVPAWSSLTPYSYSGGGAVQMPPVLNTESLNTKSNNDSSVGSNSFSNEPWASEWTVPDITSEDPPQIGDTYIQTAYDADSQSIIQNVWEYKPGLSMYDLPSEINLGQGKLSNISREGWVLKERRIINGVTGINRRDGKIVNFEQNGKEVEFSDNVNWDKEYVFNYNYNKDKQGNWQSSLNIKDKTNGEIVESVNLASQDIESIKDINSLIDMITYEPDKDKRDEIIAQIEEMVKQGDGSDKNIELAKNISNLLYSENTNEIVEAAKILRKVKDPRAVDPLIKALKENEDFYVREVAAWALAEIGEPAVEPLIKALGDKNSDVRANAAEALGKIGDSRAVEPLIKALGDEDHYVRENVAWALGSIGDSRAVEPLIKALGDEDRYVRENAARALVKIGEPAVDPLLIKAVAVGDENPDVRAEAAGVLETLIKILVKIGEPAVGALINVLGDKNADVREIVDLLVGLIGAPAVEPLIEALKNPELKQGAKEVLINIGNPAFIPVIEELLLSDNPDLQNDGVDIIKGIAEAKKGRETGLNPDIDILSLKSMSQDDLEKIASNNNNNYSITKALALYYLGKKYQDEGFLRNYIFNEDNGKLYVENENITKLEIAAILNTGIPAQAGWWDKLADKKERKKYIKLVLKGDFTDERNYFSEYRAWECVQYATQMAINANGFNNLFAKGQIADKEVFEKSGYVIFPVGYGIPIFYATTHGHALIGHAFNAVWVGDGEINNDISNWIFIEPQDDSFSPVVLGDSVTVYPNAFFLPDDGGYCPAADTIKVPTSGYPYGADR